MGVIAKFATNLNPGFFGKSACFTLAHVKEGSDQSELIEKLSRHPEVVGAVTSLENMVQIITLFGTPQELNVNVDRIKILEEVEEIENYLLLMPGPTLPPVKISGAGWKIFRALKDNCRKSDQQVARELGISTKTVKRNVTYLQRNGVIVFMIYPDTSSGDLLAYTLIVKYAKMSPDAISKLRTIVRRIFYIWRVANEEAVICTVFLDRLREIEGHVKRLKTLPEIKEIIAFTPTKMYYFDSWMNRIVDKH